KENRQPQTCRDSAERYRASRPKVDDSEAPLLESLLEEAQETPTLDNGLGLFDPAQCTPRIPPNRPGNVPLITEAASACLDSLRKLIQKHRETPVKYENWHGQQTEDLLGNMDWNFPDVHHRTSREENLARLPLRELWETWWEGRPAVLRDPD